MLTLAFQFVVSLLIIQSSSIPIRTGDVARQLTGQDLADLELVLPSGAKPWLFNGDPSRIPGVLSIQAYLSPTTATSTLRRGTVFTVTRRTLPLTAWTVERSWSYAQVAIPGRQFDKIEGDQDINRPFFVISNFDDTELVGLVRFLRSDPPTVGGKVSHWPILDIQREVDDSVEVRTRGAVGQGQVITLRQTGSGWAIIRVGMWIV